MAPEPIARPARFVKRPVVVEAIQYDGTEAAVEAICDWVHSNGAAVLPTPLTAGADQRWGIRIETLEGAMTAIPGDWVIRGIAGEFYPCKPDIFAGSYSPAGNPDEYAWSA